MSTQKILKAAKKAIDKMGPTELAKRLGVQPQVVGNWRSRGVPPDRVLAVEEITGISRYELRPDVFGEQRNEARPA